MAAPGAFSEIRATGKTVSDQRFGGFVGCRKGDRRGVGAAGCVGVATKDDPLTAQIHASIAVPSYVLPRDALQGICFEFVHARHFYKLGSMERIATPLER